MAEHGEETESWEDLEDSGELDKRIQQITILKREPQNKSATSAGGVIPQEENQRTAYQPSVKILKRQTNSGDNAQNSASAANKQQAKTLEQREAEYAEARMRIFGATPASPEPEESVPPRPERLLQRVEEMRVNENVIRQPRGPDPSGDRGFTEGNR